MAVSQKDGVFCLYYSPVLNAPALYATSPLRPPVMRVSRLSPIFASTSLFAASSLISVRTHGVFVLQTNGILVYEPEYGIVKELLLSYREPVSRFFYVILYTYEQYEHCEFVNNCPNVRIFMQEKFTNYLHGVKNIVFRK